MNVKNYFPACNSGETLSEALKKDNYRLYYNYSVYTVKDMYLISDFTYADLPRTWDGQFIVFEVDCNIDYAVLTSLN